MPWARTLDGVIIIRFGKGDLVALTGYWSDKPDHVGITIAETPQPFTPGRPPKAQPGTPEGRQGERAIVRFAFSNVAEVEPLIAALEDVKVALREMAGG